MNFTEQGPPWHSIEWSAGLIFIFECYHSSTLVYVQIWQFYTSNIEKRFKLTRISTSYWFSNVSMFFPTSKMREVSPPRHLWWKRFMRHHSPPLTTRIFTLRGWQRQQDPGSRGQLYFRVTHSAHVCFNATIFICFKSIAVFGITGFGVWKQYGQTQECFI